MTYTVNKLAKISGVSVRTLHFYDEIGLLKPAYIGENNYRYYEEEQLLMLQQILFYRELGMSLSEIQAIITGDNFDKIEALLSHKKILEKSIDRSHQMLVTIDKTLSHLRGVHNMKHEELYYGFDSEIQKQHEKTLVERKIVTQEFLDECNSKIKNWSDKEKNAFIQDIENIMADLVTALENKVQTSSEEVQALMARHYAWIERSWNPTRDSYLGLIELYQTPDFRVFYDKRHPQLLNYMVEAMTRFAANKFK